MEQLRPGWLLKPLAVTLLALVLFGMGYWLGLRSALVQVVAGTGPQAGPLRWVQFDPQQQLQPAPDPRELIPLQPGPGQGRGQGQAEECPLLIYQDGQLFRFELPQPMPGPGGPQPGPGMPGGSPELIPLDPSVPSLPAPPAPPDSWPGQST
jgi:hypothetical protein